MKKKNIKKIMFILLVGVLTFLIGNNNVYAEETQLLCEYTGEWNTFGESMQVKFLVELNDNAWNLKSATLNDNSICRSGSNLSDCLAWITDNRGSFKFDNMHAIKKNYRNYYELITDSNEYTNYFVSGDKYSCPNDLVVLAAETEVDTNYLLSDSFEIHFSAFVSNDGFDSGNCEGNEIEDYSCDGGLEPSNLKLNRTITAANYTGQLLNPTTSSGSCCVYKDGNTKVYTYLYNSLSGATSYAACVGGECFSADPNLSSNAQNINAIDDSGWNAYHNMGNCSNMPETIWYSVKTNGYNFYNQNVEGASAATLDTSDYCKSTVYDSSGNINKANPTTINGKCEAYLDTKLVEIINKVLTWLRILVPTLLVALGIVDFTKAVLSQDKNYDLNKTISVFIKRCIIAVAIFFVPTFIHILVDIFNKYSSVPLTPLSDCGIK